MSEAEESYWDIDGWVTDLETPRDVLVQQADLLEKHTGGVLSAEISTEPVTGGLLEHRLVISVPSLRYYYALLSVEHPAELFPVALDHDGKSYHLENIEEFRHTLKEILASD
jgi:hypothetical protein